MFNNIYTLIDENFQEGALTTILLVLITMISIPCDFAICLYNMTIIFYDIAKNDDTTFAKALRKMLLAFTFLIATSICAYLMFISAGLMAILMSVMVVMGIIALFIQTLI